MKRRESRFLTFGACLLLVGGASLTLRAEQMQTSAPQPGTRDYYQQKIKGAYVFYQGELIQISSGDTTRSQLPGVTRARPIALSTVSSTAPSSARWLEGRALQVLSNTLVVIGRPVTNALGVVSYTHSGVVALTSNVPVLRGDLLRILAVSDGTYQYRTASDSGSMTAYREVAEPTFEEYLKVYERDRQAADLEPILSVERAEALVPTLVRPAAIVPAESAPSINSTSYVERLRARKRQEQKQTADGSIEGTFVYHAVDNAVTIKRYNGDESVIEIPDKIAGLPVTGIGNSAFAEHGELTRVRLPACITNIGDWAFGSCTNLTDIVLPAPFAHLEDYFRIGISGRQIVTMLERAKEVDQQMQIGTYGCAFIKRSDTWITKSNLDENKIQIFDSDKDVEEYWLNQVDLLAFQYQVCIIRRQVSASVKTETHFEQQCLYKEWEGTLKAFMTFLNALRQQEIMIDVGQVSISPSPQKEGYYRGSFAVWYTYRGGKPLRLVQDPGTVVPRLPVPPLPRRGLVAPVAPRHNPLGPPSSTIR